MVVGATPTTIPFSGTGGTTVFILILRVLRRHRALHREAEVREGGEARAGGELAYEKVKLGRRNQ